MKKGFLDSQLKTECLGCEACVQICTKSAIEMQADREGFRYPLINTDLCVDCGLCRKVCPITSAVEKSIIHPYTYGGHIKDNEALFESTSGGAFSAIALAWAEQGRYVIFGAENRGLEVFHTYIENVEEMPRLRRSKYSQSNIGNSYKHVRSFLKDGKRVLFSGTPCHIAGLRNYLGKIDTSNLLTIEVICEGVPSPLYINKLGQYITEKYGSEISRLDYRSKGIRTLGSPIPKKWDFEVMQASLRSGRELTRDRWFNPFWSIWLQHLMSRPSCYECPFATQERVSDISLGDLWGVHLYCPELYNENRGASLVVCNTDKGEEWVKAATKYMEGHELQFEDALRYQSPMRKHIDFNPQRELFMADLMNTDISYKELTEKWAVKPSIKLLWQKYIYGNRQKVFLWNMKQMFKK